MRNINNMVTGSRGGMLQDQCHHTISCILLKIDSVTFACIGKQISLYILNLFKKNKNICHSKKIVYFSKVNH